MSYLDEFSRELVSRGCLIANNDGVLDYQKVEEKVYRGKVKGSGNNVYDVDINCTNPHNSICTCPYYQNEGELCKHMVALYFICLPKELENYNQSMVMNIASEMHQYGRDEFFNYLPPTFHQLTKEFIDSLSEEEVREVLYGMMANIYCYEYAYDYYLESFLEQTVKKEDDE